MLLNKYITKSGYSVAIILKKRCNIIFVTNKKTNLIIDSNRKKNRKLLSSGFSNYGISKIDFLFLTHSHFDHSENAQYIKSKFNSKVIIHKSEAAFLSNGYSPLPSGTFPVTRLLINIIGKRIQHRFAYEPCIPDIVFDDNFSLNGLGFNGYIMHTPGHSVGSSSLILDDEICIAGDSMFGIFKNSIFPPYADDTRQLVSSWEKLLNTNCKLFIPSHGTPKSRDILHKCYKKMAKKLNLI